MFIAVISEGFAIPEHLKHKEQLSAFVAKIEPKARPARWRRMLNPYEHLRTTDASAVAVALEYAQLPSEMILPMRKSFVREFVAARSGQRVRTIGDACRPMLTRVESPEPAERAEPICHPRQTRTPARHAVRSSGLCRAR